MGVEIEKTKCKEDEQKKKKTIVKQKKSEAKKIEIQRKTGVGWKLLLVERESEGGRVRGRWRGRVPGG